MHRLGKKNGKLHIAYWTHFYAVSIVWNIDPLFLTSCKVWTTILVSPASEADTAFGCYFLIGFYASWVEVVNDHKWKKKIASIVASIGLATKHLLFLGNVLILFLVDNSVEGKLLL